jgi:selenocysteine lyase/cysteine desulfurase
MKTIEEHEFSIAEYAMKKFNVLKDDVKVIGPQKDRIALFSFIVKNHENFNQVGEFFAERNICLRC